MDKLNFCTECIEIFHLYSLDLDTTFMNFLNQLKKILDWLKTYIVYYILLNSHVLALLVPNA